MASLQKFAPAEISRYTVRVEPMMSLCLGTPTDLGVPCAVVEELHIHGEDGGTFLGDPFQVLYI